MAIGIPKVFGVLLIGTGLLFLLYVLGNYHVCQSKCPGTHRNFSSTKDGKCLRKYFEDVLLIIVYHYPMYSTSALIISHYEQAFPSIVVCGPKQSDSRTILQTDMGPRGYYSYHCLARAMQTYPGYRGYLFVNDDMIVNWWNFATLDKEKIWQGARINVELAHELGHRPVSRDWMWWVHENGAVNCEKTYKQILGLTNQTQIDVRKLLKTHLRNGRGKRVCFRTWSDFVYIPGRFSRKFRLLDGIFLQNKVFLEIALPTIMSLLADWDDMEKVYGTYLTEVYGFQDFSNIKYVWREFKEDVPFLHPVKLVGNKGTRNRKLLERRVISYGRQFTTC